MNFHNPDSLYGILFQVGRLHYQRMHMLLEETGIYPGQPPLIMALSYNDGQSQKELADKLKVKPATITVMLKRMEKCGLVERKQDANDQRISRVYLTDKAKDVVNKLVEIMNNIREECFNDFTEEEMMIFRKMVMKMRDNLTDACKKKNI